jgi:hypothetical protein
MVKFKNTITIIILMFLSVLLNGCLQVDKVHDDSKMNELHILKTEDDVFNADGFQIYKYNYKIMNSSHVKVNIEIYEKGKLLKNEFIEKDIKVEKNNEATEKIELSVLKGNQSNVIWRLQHGEKSVDFTTPNLIDKCNSKLMDVISEGHIKNKETAALIIFKGNYTDKADINNETDNKEKQIKNNDLVIYFNVFYEVSDLPH